MILFSEKVKKNKTVESYTSHPKRNPTFVRYLDRFDPKHLFAMMQTCYRRLLLLWALIFPLLAFTQEDQLLTVIREEMNREFNELQEKENPPYYMEFRVADSYTVSFNSNMGCVIDEGASRDRIFSPGIRVGDYSFDNTHTLDRGYYGYSGESPVNNLPVDGKPDAVKYKIWEITNEYYRSVVDEYLEKKREVDSTDMKSYDDFTREEPEKYFEAPDWKNFTTFDPDPWKEKLNKYTASFKNAEGFVMASGTFMMSKARIYYINTEGFEVVQNKSLYVLSFYFACRSAEDEFIPYSEAFYAFSPEKLPSEEDLMNRMAEVKVIMEKLMKAPKAEPFTGPAILSAGATGVFFHEIFGHRIEGHRLDDSFNSRTFKDKVGKQVIDKTLSVVSDPTMSEYNETDLMGHYLYDSQGIKSRKVVNVENGILLNFLMSRKPIEGFNKSNGHGRATVSLEPVSRQSNLIISTDKPVSMEEMRKKLIKECKKQDLPYGYYFKDVSGGFTNTMNYMPDFLNIYPTEVFRVYVDGRPDELVRGVNLIGTPLIMFSEILAAGDTPAVFSGMCGAESGSVPVSTVAPALLVRKIETQNQYTFPMEWPVLKDPETETIQNR